MAEPDFPDIYSDSVAVSVGNFGVAITLYLSDPVADEAFRETVGRVRMSVDLARAMNDLLAQALAKIPPPTITDLALREPKSKAPETQE